MGNLLLPNAVNETTIESTDIFHVDDDRMMSSIFTFELYYHETIQEDCKRILNEAKNNNKTVVIFWTDDFTIHGIGFKNESRQYISNRLQPCTFGYTYRK